MLAFGRHHAAFADDTARFFMDVELTMAQFRALAAIRRWGRQTGRELAQRLRVTPGTLVPLFDRLEELGYLRRVPDKDDRRLTWLELTPKTERLFERLWGVGAARLTLAVSRLMPRDRAELKRLLHRLAEPDGFDAVGELGLGSLLQAHTPLMEHAFPIRPQRGLRKGRDFASQPLGLGEPLSRLDDAVDKTNAKCLLRLYGAARKNQVEGAALAHDSGQSDGPHVDERHAEPTVEHAKGGVACGNPEVAPQRQFEAAGDGVALDRREHRLAHRHPGRAHRPRALQIPVPRTGRQRLEVEAGAERASGTGQNRDRQAVVEVEPVERFA